MRNLIFILGVLFSLSAQAEPVNFSGDWLGKGWRILDWGTLDSYPEMNLRITKNSNHLVIEFNKSPKDSSIDGYEKFDLIGNDIYRANVKVGEITDNEIHINYQYSSPPGHTNDTLINIRWIKSGDCISAQRILSGYQTITGMCLKSTSH